MEIPLALILLSAVFTTGLALSWRPPRREASPVPGHGDLYVRRRSTRRYEPGTVFREAWGFGVVVDCREVPSGAHSFGPPSLYDVRLRRLSEREEAVRDVMTS